MKELDIHDELIMPHHEKKARGKNPLCKLWIITEK